MPRAAPKEALRSLKRRVSDAVFARAELVFCAAMPNEVIARLADRCRRPGPRSPGRGLD
jgi:hypothetical protein